MLLPDLFGDMEVSLTWEARQHSDVNDGARKKKRGGEGMAAHALHMHGSGTEVRKATARVMHKQEVHHCHTHPSSHFLLAPSPTKNSGPGWLAAWACR